MHDFDSSVPRFITHVRDTCIVFTLELIFEVLHVPRVSHPDYLECPFMRTVSKDELLSLFYETPSSWGDCQNTSCSGFAKGLKFLNMVMRFVLHPLFHYNSITEPRACLLLSLTKDLTIDFPSRFILSVIDAYKDTTTRDKLIFPSAITRIISHASISYFESGCHQCSVCSTERGPASTKVATDSSPFHSIHLCSFFFFEWWCNARGHHGAA